MRTVSADWKRADLARRAPAAPTPITPRPMDPPSYPHCRTCGVPLPGDRRCPNAGPQWPHEP